MHEGVAVIFVARKETKHLRRGRRLACDPNEVRTCCLKARGIWFHPSVHEIKAEAAKQRRLPKADGFYE